MLYPKHTYENIVLKLVFLINELKNINIRQLLLYISKKKTINFAENLTFEINIF